jgi:hypothetical protein
MSEVRSRSPRKETPCGFSTEGDDEIARLGPAPRGEVALRRRRCDLHESSLLQAVSPSTSKCPRAFLRLGSLLSPPEGDESLTQARPAVYPAGWTESLAVDTIAASVAPDGARGELRDRLEACGFQARATGTSFCLDEILYVLDVVDRHLPGDYSEDHLVQVGVDVDDAAPPDVTLVGPEDLLLDYLESAVATRHQRDWARALAIANVLGGDLDLGYLYTKTHERLEGRFVDDLDRLLAGEPLDDGG